jgi:hypothetical protein
MFFKVYYEWGRVFTMGIVGSILMALFYLNDYLRGDVNRFALDDPARRRVLYLSILIKVCLTISFPAVLFALKFFTDNERQRVVDAWRRVSSELRRSPLNEAVGD